MPAGHRDGAAAREWFAGVDDESIVRLLDPLEECGTPDAVTPGAWRVPPTASGAVVSQAVSFGAPGSPRRLGLPV